MNARHSPCGLVNGPFTGTWANPPFSGPPNGLELSGPALILQ